MLLLLDSVVSHVLQGTGIEGNRTAQCVERGEQRTGMLLRSWLCPLLCACPKQEAVRHTSAQLGSLRRGLADKASYADVQTLLGKVQGRASMFAQQDVLADIDEGSDAEGPPGRDPLDTEQVYTFVVRMQNPSAVSHVHQRTCWW